MFDLNYHLMTIKYIETSFKIIATVYDTTIM